MTGCLELKPSQFLSCMTTWNRREHPTNQQVFSVVFQESFPAARSWCWSSLFTAAAACDGYLSFIFKHTHTHTHTLRPAHVLHRSRTFHICTRLHTWTRFIFFTPPSPSPLLSFWQHNFQLNFQQKCATLSPSAGVVTLSYSGKCKSNFLVRD